MNRRIDRQGGWAGLLVLLLALLIVAWLAKDALVKYGLVPSARSVAQPAAPDANAPGGGAAGGDSTASVPRTPMDAARNLESVVKQQEDKRGGGY